MVPGSDISCAAGSPKLWNWWSYARKLSGRPLNLSLSRLSLVLFSSSGPIYSIQRKLARLLSLGLSLGLSLAVVPGCCPRLLSPAVVPGCCLWLLSPAVVSGFWLWGCPGVWLRVLANALSLVFPGVFFGIGSGFSSDVASDVCPGFHPGYLPGFVLILSTGSLFSATPTLPL